MTMPLAFFCDLPYTFLFNRYSRFSYHFVYLPLFSPRNFYIICSTFYALRGILSLPFPSSWPYHCILNFSSFCCSASAPKFHILSLLMSFLILYKNLISATHNPLTSLFRPCSDLCFIYHKFSLSCNFPKLSDASVDSCA